MRSDFNSDSENQQQTAQVTFGHAWQCAEAFFIVIMRWHIVIIRSLNKRFMTGGELDMRRRRAATQQLHAARPKIQLQNKRYVCDALTTTAINHRQRVEARPKTSADCKSIVWTLTILQGKLIDAEGLNNTMHSILTVQVLPSSGRSSASSHLNVPPRLPADSSAAVTNRAILCRTSERRESL